MNYNIVKAGRRFTAAMWRRIFQAKYGTNPLPKFNAIRCSAVPCGAVRCGAVWDGVVWYDMT